MSEDQSFERRLI